MANQWFKFYGGEYLSDPKIERLNPIERSCWITILCMASMGDDGVIEFLTVESLLNRSGIQFDPYHPEDWEKALGVLIKFQNLKMIECDTEGRITVLNWEKRQEHNLTVAERVAKSRANKKSNENVTMNVTNVTTEENRIEENRIDKELPLWLNKDKWREWMEYRKQSKKKMTAITIKKQIELLSKDIKNHTKIIDRSITMGWQGLFPLDNKNFSGNGDAQKVLRARMEDDEAKREREESVSDNEARRKLNRDISNLGNKMKI